MLEIILKLAPLEGALAASVTLVIIALVIKAAKEDAKSV